MNVRGLIDWSVAHFKAVMAVLVGLSAVFLFISAVLIKNSDYSPSATLLDLNIAPVFSSITLDGNSVSQGTIEVEPGTHHLAFTAEGFESKEYDVDVKSGRTNSVSDYLLNSENGLLYYENSEADMDALHSVDDETAKEFVSKFDKKYSLKTHTPFSEKYGYSRHYGMMKVTFGEGSSKCHVRLCLIVKDAESEESRAALRKALASRGYNVDDYEVVYE